MLSSILNVGNALDGDGGINSDINQISDEL